MCADGSCFHSIQCLLLVQAQRMSAQTTHLQLLKVVTQLGDLILYGGCACRGLLLTGPVSHATCINSGRGLQDAVQVRILCLWCSNRSCVSV